MEAEELFHVSCLFLSAASPPVSCIVEWREITTLAMLDVERLSGSLDICSDKMGFD